MTDLSTPEVDRQRVIRTLIVEDDDPYAELEAGMLSQVLDPKFILSRATILKEAKEALGHGNIDLVLLDLFLPDSFGLDTLVQIRRSFPFVPILVLTGVGDEKLGIAAIKEGADDYLLKNQIRQQLLPRLIIYAIERKKHEIGRIKLLESERQARLEADHAIFIRDRFISIANHELKTPLTSLRLRIQLLKKTLTRSGAVDAACMSSLLKMVGLVDHDLERFGNLIDSLMDLSQIQAGKLALKLGDTNLRKVVEGVVLSFQAQTVAAGCNVRVHGDAEVIGQWDCLRLEQVVSNLLMNAMKYAPGGEIELKIEQKGDFAFLEVRDHGPGIACQDLARLFQPFERATAGHGIAGLGLGLYITQKIIQSHGGTILVRSQPGRGTTFVIQIPKKQPNASEQNDEQIKLAS